MSTLIPTEEELHAYLDGELAADRHTVVTEYLGHSPEEARRLQAYRADGEMIARVFAHADEIMPERRPALRFRLASLSKPWQFAAALAVLILAGGLGLFWQYGHTDARGNRLANEAAAAHMLAANAPSTDASLEEIAQFLSAPLTTPVKLRNPASGEYRLVGSRLLTTPRGRVAQLAFRGPDQTVVTMYLEPWPGNKDTPFRPVDTGRRDITTLLWTDDEVACAVTGALPADRLEQIARSLYEAVFS